MNECGTQLTDEELALLQEETQLWYQSVCSIYYTLGADDVYGGRDKEHGGTASLTGIPCSIESGSGQENAQSFEGKIEDVQLFTVSFPPATIINVGDHLTVTSGIDTVHLLVQAELFPEDFQMERKVIATELGSLR